MCFLMWSVRYGTEGSVLLMDEQRSSSGEVVISMDGMGSQDTMQLVDQQVDKLFCFSRKIIEYCLNNCTELFPRMHISKRERVQWKL